MCDSYQMFVIGLKNKNLKNKTTLNKTKKLTLN